MFSLFSPTYFLSNSHPSPFLKSCMYMRKWRGWNHQRENPVKLTLPLLFSLLPFLLCKQNTHWKQRNPTPKDPTQRIYIENKKNKKTSWASRSHPSPSLVTQPYRNLLHLSLLPSTSSNKPQQRIRFVWASRKPPLHFTTHSYLWLSIHFIHTKLLQNSHLSPGSLLVPKQSQTSPEAERGSKCRAVIGSYKQTHIYAIAQDYQLNANTRTHWSYSRNSTNAPPSGLHQCRGSSAACATRFDWPPFSNQGAATP